MSKISYSQNGKLDDYKIDNIKNVIALFKQKNIEKISKIINFPLSREYPIPSIKDKNEFRKRFNEVFDKTLVDKIANSKIKQWSEVGWRGIMLDNGIVWIESDNVKITAINYQSEFEMKLRNDLIAKEKENLYVSLKTFKSSTYKIKTKSYLIRIDELSNHKYRYASWKSNKTESIKPDIILNNGELELKEAEGIMLLPSRMETTVTKFLEILLEKTILQILHLKLKKTER